MYLEVSSQWEGYWLPVDEESYVLNIEYDHLMKKWRKKYGKVMNVCLGDDAHDGIVTFRW